MNQHIAVSESRTDRFSVCVIFVKLKKKMEAMYIVYTRNPDPDGKVFNDVF